MLNRTESFHELRLVDFGFGVGREFFHELRLVDFGFGVDREFFHELRLVEFGFHELRLVDFGFGVWREFFHELRLVEACFGCRDVVGCLPPNSGSRRFAPRVELKMFPRISAQHGPSPGFLLKCFGGRALSSFPPPGKFAQDSNPRKRSNQPFL